MTKPDWVEREARERQELLDTALDAVFAERSFPNLERLVVETPPPTVEQATKVWDAIYARMCSHRNGAK